MLSTSAALQGAALAPCLVRCAPPCSAGRPPSPLSGRQASRREMLRMTSFGFSPPGAEGEHHEAVGSPPSSTHESRRTAGTAVRFARFSRSRGPATWSFDVATTQEFDVAWQAAHPAQPS